MDHTPAAELNPLISDAPNPDPKFCWIVLEDSVDEVNHTQLTRSATQIIWLCSGLQKGWLYINVTHGHAP